MTGLIGRSVGGNKLAAGPTPFSWRLPIAAFSMCIAYYAGARLGFTLTFEPYPTAVMWPPNALLFAALLITPVAWWWALIAAVFPAHLLAEFQRGITIPMLLSLYISNVGEALLGAAIVRRFAGHPLRLNKRHSVVVFYAACALAPTLSSFVDAAFMHWFDWREVSYWRLWRARCLSNILSMLIFVPVALAWVPEKSRRVRATSRAHQGETLALMLGLLVVSVLVFDSDIVGSTLSPVALYLPLPFLVWAALRFGPPLTSVLFSIFALAAIWGVSRGHGPFFGASIHDNAMQTQLFLISVAVPALLLAAVMEEGRAAGRLLSASEERFATAFRSSPDAIAISKRIDGTIIESNDRWHQLLEVGQDKIPRSMVALVSVHLREPDRARWIELIHSNVPGDLDIDLHDGRGHRRQTLVSVRSEAIAGQRCLITTVRDITAQRNAEANAARYRQQLTHLSRVASLSDLSAALAHELNQPLTAILSNAQAAQRFLSHKQPNLVELSVILSEIIEADKRAGQVIHRLRALIKRGDESFGPVGVNQLATEVLQFLHSEFVTHNIEVVTSYAPDLPPINGDPVQLQQLILNLSTNACEAMRGEASTGRRLNVTTLQAADGGVQLVVSDTGPGLPVADGNEAIFEPFFTTKQNGLGLGLSICRTIARTHGGSLSAESHDGPGASFRLMLPPAEPGRRPPMRPDR